MLRVVEAHWSSAVDLINTDLQEAAAEVRHTLVTLRQLVTLYDPVNFQRDDA